MDKGIYKRMGRLRFLKDYHRAVNVNLPTSRINHKRIVKGMEIRMKKELLE